MPNFDQWLNPAIEAPVSSQKVPAIIDDELDAELTMNDPDPTTPFFMFVHAGYRRLGEVGHYVRKRTKGLARVVSIDTKRRGYAHNILLPRVFTWLARLAVLTLCIGIILSGPCELFTPLRFELSTSGPPVSTSPSVADVLMSGPKWNRYTYMYHPAQFIFYHPSQFHIVTSSLVSWDINHFAHVARPCSSTRGSDGPV